MTTYDELTPDALFLLENVAELDIVQTCAERGARITELTAELAALRSGEEPYDDERLMPTPGQWIWRWNRAEPEERLAIAGARVRIDQALHDLVTHHLVTRPPRILDEAFDNGVVHATGLIRALMYGFTPEPDTVEIERVARWNTGLRASLASLAGFASSPQESAAPATGEAP